MQKRVMLTFDDGPIPEATPLILDILRNYNVKGTFFLVGDNVRKYPHLLPMILADGHAVGNHTMHHLQGIRTRTGHYIRDVREADDLIHSPLFRPPHGILRSRQIRHLRNSHRIIMYDLVTRDYSRHVSAPQIVANVKRLTRPGSIIVFHDSLRSIHKLHSALPQSIEWLLENNYKCILPNEL